MKSLLVALLLAAPAQLAAADGLILRDGSRLETRGSWEVKGSRVILTLPDGKLASIATREVDLARSHSGAPPAPTIAESPPVARPGPAPKPVLVLTNRDLPAAAAPTNPRAVTNSPETSGSGSEVHVEFWAVFPADRIDGVEIRGVLRNPSSTAVRISWTEVEIVDSRGGIRRQKAVPVRPLLGAGESTSFLARFPDLEEDHGDPGFIISLDDEADDSARLSGGSM